jgi:uncharacterized protein
MQKSISRPTYTNELKKWIDKPQVKVLTGIRRCGKSTALTLLKAELLALGKTESQITQLSFESFSTEHLKNAQALYAHLQVIFQPNQKHYLLLDEIQEVTDWEKAVNALLVDFDVDVYLTGSNAKLLSSELATYLAGRYVEISMYTLSFKEYLAFQQAYYPEAQQETSASFTTYLRKGGFPVIHALHYEEEEAYKVVRDIYASVILRDTIQRHQIRDIELLERVIRFAFDNIGNTFSGKSIADFFKNQFRKTDVNTIYNYLNALEEAFVLYRVSRYDLKGKEILKTQEKFYVSDVSLIYAMLGYRDLMIAGLLENLVFLELKRRGYTVYIGKLGTQEIDFIAEKRGAKMYIQVAYKLESESTVSREFGPLLTLNDQYPKYVVTMDDFWKEDVEGVRHLQMQDFLLADFF